MKKKITCPNCLAGELEETIPFPIVYICRNCKFTFTIDELVWFWGYDAGDFYDVHFINAPFPVYEIDYSLAEQRVFSTFSPEIEPPWGEIEEALWDIPDAYTIMEQIKLHEPIYAELIGYGRDGRL